MSPATGWMTVGDRVRLTEEVGGFKPPAYGTVQCMAPDIVGIRMTGGLFGLLTWTDLETLERQVDPDSGDRGAGREARREKHQLLAAEGRPVVWNPQGGYSLWVDPELMGRMREAGYEPWHTGGGCMAWGRSRDDGGHELVTWVDVDLGRWADRDDPQWLHGSYDCEGDPLDEGPLEGVTLERALADG